MKNAAPVAWLVIDAAGFHCLFHDEDKAYEYANFAHGPRHVYQLIKKEPK